MNQSMNDSDFEIVESENYRGEDESVFSHQSLVMSQTKRVLESSNNELIEGYWNEKTDRMGNLVRTYIPDQRKILIEKVEALLNLMYPDLDEEAMKKINALIKKFNENKQELLEDQWRWYSSLSPSQKNQLKGEVSKNFFNTNYGWYSEKMQLEVYTYKKIFRELCLLTKRLNYFKVQEFYDDAALRNALKE